MCGIIRVLHLFRVEIHESARRHGVADEDIQHALAHTVIWSSWAMTLGATCSLGPTEPATCSNWSSWTSEEMSW